MNAGREATVIIEATGSYTGAETTGFTIAKAANPMKAKSQVR